ncbi:MAG: lipoyl(octanoyl) transferase LipB [Alphaproteobacteria bacterium]|nr:lipoyl(octanoyl) transferase LipB [Alphaproteobacteria bacterium]MDD9920372.1 lipoyl(octanoyl) transferase LipB [Alphaproteobacteria bacterium]
MAKTQIEIEYIGQEKTYEDVLAYQEACVAQVLAGGAEKLLMVEHSPVFTMGTSAKQEDVLNAGNTPVIKTGRGGQITYHGPRQQVIYPIIDLTKRKKDIRWYISELQGWLIDVLAELGVEAFTTDDVGIWVNTPQGEAKIAAIGVRVRKWVTFHGVALNISPDLNMYDRIVPCGISDKGVTSLERLGLNTSQKDISNLLIPSFLERFSL